MRTEALQRSALFAGGTGGKAPWRVPERSLGAGPQPQAVPPVIATLLQLFWLFTLLSMVAFGGGAGVIPDIQRAAVDVHHWLTAKEFLDLFAISRTAPAPGSMIAAMVGEKAAGVAGGLRSFAAMSGPPSVIVHFGAPA